MPKATADWINYPYGNVSETRAHQWRRARQHWDKRTKPDLWDQTIDKEVRRANRRKNKKSAEPSQVIGVATKRSVENAMEMFLIACFSDVTNPKRYVPPKERAA